MSTFTVLYFAAASSFTTLDSESFKAPLSISKFFPLLEQRHPGITSKILGSCLVTVNLDYVDIPDQDSKGGMGDEFVIQPGDEVAIIPPVSSG